jgi:hypothetical protein
MIAAIVVRDGGDERVEAVVTRLMPLINREISLKRNPQSWCSSIILERVACVPGDESVQQMANEIAELLKEKIGEARFNDAFAKCRKAAAVKSELRKRRAKEQAVANPAMAARRKTKRQAAKLKSRKRKIDIAKPYRVTKRQRREMGD